MNTLKKSAPMLLMLCSLLVSCFGTAWAYDNDTYDFSITSPLGWEQTEGTSIFQVVGFVNPIDYAAINVGVEEIPSWATVSDYVKSGQNFSSQQFSDYVIISERSRIINGLDCIETLQSMTLDGQEIKTQQAVFVENSKAYIISYVALPTVFDSNWGYYEQSLQSFRITATNTQPSQQALADSNNSPYTIPLLIGGVLIVIIICTIVLIFFLKTKSSPAISQPSSITTFSAPTVNMGNQATSEAIFCRFCGAQTKADTVFCEKCGKQLID